mmetsp:Transcript_72007/g.210947  ORF Transcript_72007/g.210947 Transcript_72007/m.210947 type:complete len:203 (+) Transcript_72007:413-1021(+)
MPQLPSAARGEVQPQPGCRRYRLPQVRLPGQLARDAGEGSRRLERQARRARAVRSEPATGGSCLERARAGPLPLEQGLLQPHHHSRQVPTLTTLAILQRSGECYFGLPREPGLSRLPYHGGEADVSRAALVGLRRADVAGQGVDCGGDVHQRVLGLLCGPGKEGVACPLHQVPEAARARLEHWPQEEHREPPSHRGVHRQLR